MLLLRMNSQKCQKKDFDYPEEFTEDDKLQFDMLLVQAKSLFPQLENDEWLIKQAIIAFMKKEKGGNTDLPTDEEIAKIRNSYTSETVFYTPQNETSAVSLDIDNLVYNPNKAETPLLSTIHCA
jgi:hypothetical protein